MCAVVGRRSACDRRGLVGRLNRVPADARAPGALAANLIVGGVGQGGKTVESTAVGA